jgi:hypothetical protein
MTGLRPWRAIACLVLLVAMPCPVAAASEDEPRLAGGGDALATSDTDSMSSLRATARGLSYDNPWSFRGVATQGTRYSQGEFHDTVPAILGIYRDQRRDTLAGVDIEAGVARVAGHLRPMGEATLRLSRSLGSAFDLAASADLVDTRAALERGIGYTFLSAGGEREIGGRFTVAGLAGWQAFSDGNSRTHLRARLIWLALPDDGVTLQLRARQYSSRDGDVGGAYFNPGDYRQWLAVAAIRKRHAGWIYGAALGAGEERSSGTAWHPSYLAEARVEGPVATDVRLVLRAGYSRSAGFIDDPDYAYRYLGAALVIPFR